MKNILGHFTDVTSFALHTNVDLVNEVVVIAAILQKIPGVIAVVVRRYSVVVEVGYYFEVNEVRAEVLKVLEQSYVFDEVREITLDDVLARSAGGPTKKQVSDLEMFADMMKSAGEA